jgi:translation initiation factor 1A
MPPTKSKKNKKGGVEQAKSRPLEFKQGMEEYAKVTAVMGDRKFKITLPGGDEELIGIIPGKYKKGRGKRQGMWIAVDDVVLVSCREFQDGKLDIILKYVEKEINNLVQYGEIPAAFAKSASAMNDNFQDDGIVFSEIPDDDDGGIDINDI